MYVIQSINTFYDSTHMQNFYQPHMTHFHLARKGLMQYV
jgi:hypothetical protein